MSSVWGTTGLTLLGMVSLGLTALGWLGWERYCHKQALARLSLRIHVNGTRGKSGVTRLIAAGLRAGGVRTLAKVTGSEARWIDPDGCERPIRRRGMPNIREVLQAVSEAAKCDATALVCECMALQPELQEFCEQRLLESHVGVITNIRHDHEEVMGPDLISIANAYGRALPENGLCVMTAESSVLLAEANCPTEKIAAGIYTRFDQRKPAGLSLNRKQIESAALPVAALSSEELAGFSFEVESENVWLALCVCSIAGIGREVALAGMQSSRQDPGNLRVNMMLTETGLPVRWIDAMAANDPDSTRILWDRYVAGQADGVLLNARSDRRLRTRSLCSVLAEQHSGLFYLTGDKVYAAKCLLRQGVAATRLRRLEEASRQSVLAAIVRDGKPEMTTGSCFVLFAAGNYKGFHE